MNSLIQFALQHRLLVVALSLILLMGGGYLCTTLPIDIFPSLTRPRVTVMTEAAGAVSRGSRDAGDVPTGDGL
ncbi:MAG: efflux RND transporter permease subunit [Planctomycetales bacterium]